ncbi:amidase signature domain-containing protein [Aspergillus undulatus]|uniref:amidase signature domain-containing protein n=1 Tax=Aspergillus undulatus TaxID=1810928 RepID=UPI003CCDDFDE
MTIWTNCITELLMDKAIARARYLDSLPEPRGAVFGLPISTKEHHGMVGDGVATNASYACWVGKSHGSNLLYDTLWDEGCVFFARTTQPQTIMHLETNSNIFGRTVNPFNRGLAAGGSSDGEAALIGMRGSLVGIGSDIGGSIRCPAAHVGIYGFKPTTKRISSRSEAPYALVAQPWRVDPDLTVKGWEPYEIQKPLKIAVQWWDGVVQPHPPITRALRSRRRMPESRSEGRGLGQWPKELISHHEGWDIISSLYFPDGGEEVLGLLRQTGEPILPLTKLIIQEQPTVKNLTQQELWSKIDSLSRQLCSKRDQYRAKYARAWTTSGAEDGQEVDVILCPASFGAATPHDQSRYWGYTANWNLLDYPGAVFPVTTVDPVKDRVDTTYVPKNNQDKWAHEMYDPAKYTNAPVSLQVIGRRQCDEKVLAALGDIERAWKGLARRLAVKKKPEFI